MQLYCLEHGIQPDGFLTEERKAADPDHGFSTFFSETGMRDPFPSATAVRAELTVDIVQATENMSRERSIATLSLMLLTRSALEPTAVFSIPST